MRIRNLSFKYEDKIVFDHLDLDFNSDSTYIMGASGKGKSTLLKLIAGLLKPDNGTIEHDFKRISIMFQEDRLLPWLNVKDNLLLVCDDLNEVDKILKEIEIDGTKFLLTHGHLINKYTHLIADNYCLSGHTHIYNLDGKNINPGSVGIPKVNHEHTCILYQDNIFYLINLFLN